MGATNSECDVCGSHVSICSGYDGCRTLAKKSEPWTAEGYRNLVVDLIEDMADGIQWDHRYVLYKLRDKLPSIPNDRKV